MFLIPRSNPAAVGLNLSRLDGELALGEVGGALLGLVGDSAGLLLGQSPADGTGLLRAEVEGSVLLVLVEQAELGALLRVDDGKDASDRLADVVDLVQLAAGRGDLLDAELTELGLELTKLLGQIILVLAPKGDGLDLSGRHLD